MRFPWFVHYITKDGFIYLMRNGGSDHMIAPSKRVNIHTDKGIVKGSLRMACNSYERAKRKYRV